MIFFHQNIKTLRKKNRLTQKEVSEIFSTNQGTYQKWEMDRTPSLEVILKISKYYKVSLDELLAKDLSESHVSGKGIPEEAPGLGVQPILRTEDRIKLLAAIGEKEMELREMDEMLDAMFITIMDATKGLEEIIPEELWRPFRDELETELRKVREGKE